MMRQDPDVLVFGELRDASSINMALELSQTGHLVLATLHAGSQQDVEQRLGHPETLKFLMLLQVLHNHQNGLNLQVFTVRIALVISSQIERYKIIKLIANIGMKL